MKSVQEVLRLSTDFLAAKKIDRPRRLVEDLLAHLLRCKRIDVYLQFERPLEESELAVFREWIKRVSKNEPIDYVIGEMDFFGAAIKVDSRVLIPRVETELLVELAAKKMVGVQSLWDICTGSGCIGISLKKKFPQLSVSLSDLSLDAWTLAQENVKRNQLDIEVCLGDLFAPFFGKKTDFLICNPPYVSSTEFLSLDPSVRDFEPKMALIGGETGLEFYERLAEEAPLYLNPKAKVFLEIGALQGDAIKDIFNSEVWANKMLLQDLSGKDRFFFLEKQ